MRAFSTLILMIVLLAMGVTVVTTLASRNISIIQNGQLRQNTVIAQQIADSCIEEALRRLKDDISYTGGNLTMPDAISCEVSITNGTDPVKTISATVPYRSSVQHRSVTIEARQTGESVNLTITDWQNH